MTISIEKKKELIENVKGLNDIQLYQIYMMIKSDNIKHTMNNNGIFINFKNMEDELIQKIIDYTDKCIEINKNQKPDNVEFGIDKISNEYPEEKDDKTKYKLEEEEDENSSDTASDTEEDEED
jgi:hypothetical protein